LLLYYHCNYYITEHTQQQSLLINEFGGDDALTPYRIEGSHCAPDLPLIEPLGPEILHAFGFSSSARRLAADTVALAALCCAYAALAFAALLASTRFYGVKHISTSSGTNTTNSAAAANGSNSGSSNSRFKQLWQRVQQRLHFWPFQKEPLQEQPLPPPTPLVISAQVLSPRGDSRGTTSAAAAAAAATAPLLTFSQLSYSILVSKHERRVILDGVSGFAGPTTGSSSSSSSKRSIGLGGSSSSTTTSSNLVGLMGSSGAGVLTFILYTAVECCVAMTCISHSAVCYSTAHSGSH
jgi:hypothetical protein